MTVSEDEIYKNYLDRHSYWSGIHFENIRQLDENLVLLASGALVFTISITEVLKPYYNFYWLAAVWFLFCGSLVARLISFALGEKTAETKISIVGNNYQNHKDKKGDYKHDAPNDTGLEKWTRILNRVSFWSFIVGVGVFFGYAVTAGYYKQDQKTEARSLSMPEKNKMITEGQHGAPAPVQRDTKGNPGTIAPVAPPTQK